MACLFNSTTPSPGDSLVTLLNKWLQAVGGSSGCGPQSEWFSLAGLVTAYGGQPSPGDTIAGLWVKLRFAIDGQDCFCGDSEWQSARRVLDTVNPGSFRAGDSVYNILFKTVESVSGESPPEPPVVECCLLLESGGELLLESVGCLELESCP